MIIEKKDNRFVLSIRKIVKLIPKILYNMTSFFAIFTGISFSHIFFGKEYSIAYITMFTIGVIYSIWYFYHLFFTKKYENNC